MKVFIPSKGRARTISTHKVFPDSVVVVHSLQEQELYAQYHPELFYAGRIHVSNVPADTFGLTRQREYVCQNLVKKDEWFVFCDDNVKSVQALVPPYYDEEEVDVQMENCSDWRPRFNVDCSSDYFFHVVVKDTIEYCKRVGAHLAGFTLTDNVLFRAKKFRKAGYVIGKMMVWHNTQEMPFDHSISMEDFYHTAINLKMYGAAVVNNFCRPKAGHYEEGGMGRYEDRVPVRQQDVIKLMEMFPGLFRVKNRKGFVDNSDLQLRITQNNIEKWRATAA